MDKKNLFWIFLIILLLGLHFFGLSRGDTLNDEVLYGFRAIGLLDFFNNPVQTTPLEWFDPNIPWWTHLSFHDHPPLVFIIQHVFLSLFGDNLTALRLPSAILGLFSAYLLYRLGSLLYDKKTGIIAGIIFGITLNHVYISREGMMEPFVIFFIILASFFFLRAVKRGEKLHIACIALGLGCLAKYTAIFLLPVFISYLFLFHGEYFKRKETLLSFFLLVLVVSPVILYNIELYQATGHFDFQISHALGQNPEVWSIAPGKEIGSLWDRAGQFIPRMIASQSWVFLSLFVFSILGLIAQCFSDLRGSLKKHVFPLLLFFFLMLMIAKVGPAFRFLTLLTPFIALSIAVRIGFIYDALEKRGYRIFAYSLFGILIAWESLYSINNQIAYYPKGPEPWLASKIRYENYNQGYNQLDNYLTRELAEKVPALTFNTNYSFLSKIQSEAIQEERTFGYQEYPALIVYLGNFDPAPKLWIFDRRLVYHGWPTMDFDSYKDIILKNGADYYKELGFKTAYFILQDNIIPDAIFQATVKNTDPSFIENPKGEPIFTVYKKSL